MSTVKSLKIASFLSWLVLFCGCHIPRFPMSSDVVPVTHFNDSDGIVAVKSWRIIGPFKLNTGFLNKNMYRNPVEVQAFNRDYLKDLGESEQPLLLKSPSTTLPVSFRHAVDASNMRFEMSENRGKSESDHATFIDQIVETPTPTFDTLQSYWKFPRKFSITYAASNLYSSRPRDVVVIVSSNSPVKLWLNDMVIGSPNAGSVGHNPSDYYLIRVHLNSGPNLMLVKMFDFPNENAFAVRLATDSQAQKFTQGNPVMLDVLARVVLPRHAGLDLSNNLSYYKVDQTESADYQVFDVHSTEVLRGTVKLTSSRHINLPDLPNGLYTFHVSIGVKSFFEKFFVGDIKQQVQLDSAGCAGLEKKNPASTLCVLVKEIEPVVENPANWSGRLDREKKLLLLMSQIEWLKNGVTSSRYRESKGRNIYLLSYDLEGKRRYYYAYIPQTCTLLRTCPLVVNYPYRNVRDSSFFRGTPSSHPNVLEIDSYYAEKYKFGIIFPEAAAVDDQENIAADSVLGAMHDAMKNFPIDHRNVFLMGICAGGRGALLLAEEYPKMFAAVGTINAATGYVSEGDASGEETDVDDSDNLPGYYYAGADTFEVEEQLVANIRKLSHMPVQLVHGDFVPHDPTGQLDNLLLAFRRSGIDPRTIVLPNDGELGLQNPQGLTFAFFQSSMAQISNLH